MNTWTPVTKAMPISGLWVKVRSGFGPGAPERKMWQTFGRVGRTGIWNLKWFEGIGRDCVPVEWRFLKENENPHQSMKPSYTKHFTTKY